MPVQRASFLSRARIPYHKRVVPRSRDDEVSRWTDRTSTRFIRMPAQRTNERLVRQVGQRMPACQIWTRYVWFKCLAQVREFLQMLKTAQKDWSNLLIGNTSIEQVAHVGEITLEEA